MKRLLGITLALGMLFVLGGCVYDPAYYHRPGVVYDDGSATYSGPADGYYDYDDSYAPGYYYGSAYGPYCCYGGWYPWIGVGFYGGYHHGYHGGGWHGGGSHGGWHGGGGHSSGGHGHHG
jgi:hypothetical protein